MHRRLPWIAISLLSAALLPACGGDDTTTTTGTSTTTSSSSGTGGSGGSGGGGPDEDAPFVTEAQPGEGTAGVGVDTTEITLTFNEAMDPGAGTAQINDASLGAPEWNGNTVSISVSNLTYATAYRLVLDGFTDAAGNALDGAPYLVDGALDFTTEDAPDLDPPAVVTSVPVEGQVDVSLNLAEIVVTFDEPMDTSITDATIDDGAGPVPLPGAWSADALTVTFALGGGVTPSAAYAIDLSGFADAAGNLLDGVPVVGDGALDFTIMDPPDTTPPIAVASIPMEGDASVAISIPEIIVDFNEAMDVSITSAPLVAGANSAQLAGVWSQGDTRITLAVPSELDISTAYALDLTGMRDVAGNALDAADPYLADGVLDFVTYLPTGESCADPLVLSQSAPAGNAHVWTIPGATVVATDGQFACDPSTIGPDAVIRYTKTTPDLAGGGDLLHVNANTGETSTSYYLNLEVVGGACDAAGTVHKCLWYKHDWDAYLDVPAGDYYIWVAKNSPASASVPFPTTTVTIEEIPAAAAEGEGCFAPYTTASSIYTPPAVPGGPHTWTIPATINSFDMGATWGEPGSISCDNTSPYGDIHGVDAVVAFDKTSSTSVLQVNVQNLDPVLTTSDLDAEVLSVCDPNDPTKISRGCAANADTLLFTSPGPATTVYVWVAAEATGEEFDGASVAITEILPGLGEHWTTAEPLVGSGPISPTSTMRLDPPSCFPATGNIHWYSYTAMNDVVSIGTNVPGAIALLDASGAQIRCVADASAWPVGQVVGAGSTVYIAVETAGPIGALTINDVAYTGLTGTLTDLNITWPVSSTTDYGLAASGSEIFLSGTTQIFAMPKAGNATAVVHGSADGITTAHLGYDIVFEGGMLFSVDTTTSTSASRLFNVYEEAGGGWGPTAWDLTPAYPASSATYAMTTDGTNLVLATRNTASQVAFFAVSPAAPSTPVALGTNTSVDTVVGVAADAQFFYVAGIGSAAQGEGIFRIDRAAIAAPAVQIAKLDISSTRTAMGVDKITAAENLYVRQYSPSEIHVIVDPGGANPVDARILSRGTTSDYAMTYDRTAGALYFYETATDSTGRLVMMQ